MQIRLKQIDALSRDMWLVWIKFRENRLLLHEEKMAADRWYTENNVIYSSAPLSTKILGRDIAVCITTGLRVGRFWGTNNLLGASGFFPAERRLWHNIDHLLPANKYKTSCTRVIQINHSRVFRLPRRHR